jgi:Tol biopolymer transport system component
MTRFPPTLFAVLLGGLGCLFAVNPVNAERERVLQQIDLPHHYYYREMYLPQLTSGPSSLAWSPDSTQVVYSMQGSLWLQATDSTTARQLTAGPGYDYQPDWSPNGRFVLFARYLGDAVELHQLELSSGEVSRLTETGAVNVEPRWSPDGERIAWVSTIGTGRFHIRVGKIEAGRLGGDRLRPERESAPRYYYSPFDHEISPAWSPDGSELLFVSNPENAWGSGGIWRLPLAPGAEAVLVRDEETTWKAKPDWSPDGKRVTWSSYHGRQWHQLWITTSQGGGDPLPLSYGDFDITAARWSPDGRAIGFISNQSGDMELWLQESVGGARRRIEAQEREYLQPMGELVLQVVDASGNPVASRVSVTGSDGRSYAPDQAWIHADDGFDRSNAAIEQHYFHSSGESRMRLPVGEAQVTVWRGLENAIGRGTTDIPAGGLVSLELESRPLDIPQAWKDRWLSGDVHVHMNYGGAYRNTPQRMVSQARAEDLDVVFNLLVNKEQRIPDIDYFSSEPDEASDADVLLLHGQEFHTGYWGHLGLLGLDDHLLIPDYSAYPNTGMASPFPDNNTVADLAHRQNALVGWVHPYDKAPDPENDSVLTNALPIAVALGKMDYYEVSGFADYRETQQVWYRLLNCGFRLAAAGGTDAMANYASLRGPVGLNRVYVLTAEGADGDAARRDRWLQGLKAGTSMATNGPVLSLDLSGQLPGSLLTLPAGEHTLGFEGFMRSIVPVDHLEVVVNGEVVQTIRLEEGRNSATFKSEITLAQSGWVLLRAWNQDASPDIFDRFPYATTNPVFVEIGGQPVRSTADADYFIQWIERVRSQTLENTDYNTESERQAVLSSIDAALKVFSDRRQ